MDHLLLAAPRCGRVAASVAAATDVSADVDGDADGGRCNANSFFFFFIPRLLVAMAARMANAAPQRTLNA